jgi:hypothetical protein
MSNLNDKIVIGGVFILCCVIGVSLAARPRWYKSNQKDLHVIKKQNHQIKRRFEGHHPDCEYFGDHIIRFKNIVYCSGCLGLIIGCLICVVLIFLYVFLMVQFSLLIYKILVLIGLSIIIVVYVEDIIKSTSKIHLIFNVFFVLSFFLIVVSIFEITNNIIYGFVGLLFCFLWVNTRISLSKWNHKRICDECRHNCQMY